MTGITAISSLETILDRLEALKLMDKESCLSREENQAVNLGRLGEESKRLSEIFTCE